MDTQQRKEDVEVFAEVKKLLALAMPLIQDPEIAAEAGNYAGFMILSIFAYGLLECQVKFLQAQNNVKPMMFTTVITLLLHVLSCWILVLKASLGSKGAGSG
ncbi:Protein DETOXIFICATION 16 [Datura stramonium]|uniref:Protein DETOXIFICATION 16 n=1 Tax=Datura stramonium TaxID=4076 RepID=A0ABS8US77_DATST|nr:Protein DETOXIFICATION 16 [Datura stramonium]